MGKCHIKYTFQTTHYQDMYYYVLNIILITIFNVQ